MAIFPSPPFRLLIFPFILACVHCPSSTYRVNISKADTCPISLYSKVVGEASKSQRRRLLSGSGHLLAVTAAFPRYFRSFFQASIRYHFYPSFRRGTLGLPRTELPSAASKGHPIESGPQPSSAWAFGFPRIGGSGP